MSLGDAPGGGDDSARAEELLATVRELRETVARQQETIARQATAIAALEARQAPVASEPMGEERSGGTAARRAATPVSPPPEVHLPSGAGYLITFDGGAIGNPGKGYGSYHIVGPEGVIAHQRLEFEDRVTNNQAEYRTLIGALEHLSRHVGPIASTTAIAVRGDSQLVVNQVNGRWKVKNAELQPLHRRAAELLGEFGRVDLAWHERSKSVRLLGH